MTEDSGLLARAQAVVQHSRALPELAHRTFGRFSTVPTDRFSTPTCSPGRRCSRRATRL
jgi:hypothetical protein